MDAASLCRLTNVSKQIDLLELLTACSRDHDLLLWWWLSPVLYADVRDSCFTVVNFAFSSNLLCTKRVKIELICKFSHVHTHTCTHKTLVAYHFNSIFQMNIRFSHYPRKLFWWSFSRWTCISRLSPPTALRENLWKKFREVFTCQMPSVLWRCWLGGRTGIGPVTTEWWGTGMVMCLDQGANHLHMVQLMPLPLHHLLLQ